MIDNDNDGERELVLGNKQLLAIFFVATLLCGVFFAMGYVVGGNSAKAGAAAVASDSAPAPVSEGKRDEPEPPQSSAAASGNPASDNPAAADSSAFPSAEPQIADNPSASGTQPPAAAQPYEAAPAPKSNPPAAAPPDTAVSVSVPETGASYWQVAAEARPDADVLVKQLRDRQFPAILAKSSKPDLFEILVGPYRSPLSLADAKKKLIDLSFGDVFLHKQ